MVLSGAAERTGRFGTDIRNLSAFGLSEGERSGIDAVAEAGWRRTIGKDVAKMGITGGAHNLGSEHAVAHVLFGDDGSLVCGPSVTGPPSAGIKLVGGQEQIRAAADANIGA